jgi:predicted kinase
MSNKKQLKIMRGIPGSGKTTYVKENYPEAVICSADNYFEEVAELNSTSYEEEFKPWLAGKAHQHCWGSFIHAVEVMDEPLVVVDNTNISHWEYENYMFLAELHGYEVEIVEIPFEAEKAEVYYERNTHGVPLEVIERMVENYEHEG